MAAILESNSWNDRNLHTVVILEARQSIRTGAVALSSYLEHRVISAQNQSQLETALPTILG